MTDLEKIKLALEKINLRLAILDCKLNGFIDILANCGDKQKIQNDVDEVYKNLSELAKGE